MLKIYLCVSLFLISAMKSDCSKLEDFQQEYTSAKGSTRKFVKNDDGKYTLIVNRDQQLTFRMNVGFDAYSDGEHAKKIFIDRDNVLLQVLWKDKDEFPEVLRYEFSKTQLKRSLYSFVVNETMDTCTSTEPSPKGASKLDDFQKEYTSADGKKRKLVRNADGTYTLIHNQDKQFTFTMGVGLDAYDDGLHAKRVFLGRDNVLLQILWKDGNELPDFFVYEFSESQLKRTWYGLKLIDTASWPSTTQ